MNGGAEQAMKPTMKILSATVPLGRRFRVDAPPAWQIFADQDDADGTPDVGDAVGQRDQFAAVRQGTRAQTFEQSIDE
jgi:hypothetical protein